MSYNAFSSVYDLLMANVDYERISRRICSLLHENGVSGGLLLDDACGTGTLALKMSENGFDVIAADKSADMLMEAREKAARQDRDILFLCQDMTNLDLYGTVKAVVCTLDSLNHLKNISEFEKAVKTAALFLEEDGIFVFDVNTVYKHREVLANNAFVYDVENVFCVWQNELKNDTVKINLDFFVEKNGKYERFSECFSETAFEKEKIISVCENAGLETIGIFDGYSENPVKDNSERAVFVLKRKKK